MEWNLPHCNFRRQRMEWGRLLYRSVWPQVSRLDKTSVTTLLIPSCKRFERELEALRKELAEAAARSPGTSTPNLSRGGSESDLSSIVSNTTQELHNLATLPSVDITSDSSPDSTPTLESKKEL